MFPFTGNDVKSMKLKKMYIYSYLRIIVNLDVRIPHLLINVHPSKMCQNYPNLSGIKSLRHI